MSHMSDDDQVPDGYNTPIPEAIMTPDRISTRIGELAFTDGFPTSETADLIYDNLTFMRAVEVFLTCIPAASIEAMRRGMVEIGCAAANQAMITDRLLDSQPLFLTGNTDTVYLSFFLDLERDGPTVVEIPPGCGPGTVNDAWFRFVVDMGAPGPDRGAGGKYLIVPTGYEGEVPEGYFVAESPSYSNWVILRGFLVEGRPDAANEMFRTGVAAYPLAAAGDPPQMEFVSVSGRSFNTIHANDETFYEELATAVHREPIELMDPETRGLLASIGIHKDKPFEPDERMQQTLVEAAAVGNASARTIVFKTRDPRALIYPDRKWKTAFPGGDYRWLNGDGRDGRELDARTLFFYFATVNTPAMALKMVGVGSQYAYTETDADGQYLEGAKDYHLHLPAGIPAKDFWSVVVYDPQTRSELQTDDPFPSINSRKDNPQANEDGSVDLFFGPEAPANGAENWIQTRRGKGWCTLLRLYGPLEAWFDHSWKPDDFRQI